MHHWLGVSQGIAPVYFQNNIRELEHDQNLLTYAWDHM
jgi:hypothetical protein